MDTGNGNVTDKTGNRFMPISTTVMIEILTINVGYSITVSSKLSATTTTTGNGNMTAKTGNTYIFGTMTDRIEIPTANPGFLTTSISKKVCPNNCDNDRHSIMELKLFWR